MECRVLSPYTRGKDFLKVRNLDGRIVFVCGLRILTPQFTHQPAKNKRAFFNYTTNVVELFFGDTVNFF
jgi:hypothetical protein